jgi:hypothetical protein
MSFLRSVPLLILVFSGVGVWLLAGHAHGDQTYVQNPTDQPTFQVSLRKEEFMGNTNERQVQRVYLAMGTNQFALTVPEGFRVDASNPQKLVFSDVNFTYFITFRFVGPQFGSVKELPVDSYRNMVVNRFPEAKMLKESTAFADNHSGPAFDLQWKNSAGAEQSARVVFIPSGAGVMEFSLLASSSRFSDGRAFFDVLLATFRSNAGGKLQVTPLSDKS